MWRDCEQDGYFIDSSDFKDQRYNLNKRPSVRNQTITPKEPVLIGNVLKVSLDHEYRATDDYVKLHDLYPNGAGILDEMRDDEGVW